MTEPGDLQRRDGEPRRHPEHDADQQLLPKSDQDRTRRTQVDRVGGLMQRKQHRREDQRDHQAHARRHRHLAEPRQQHHHGADAREHQDEGGAVGGKERDIELHMAVNLGA